MPDDKVPLLEAKVSESTVLMASPAVAVAHIEDRAVVMCLPPGDGGLRVSRGAYEIFRRFHLPCVVAQVLPEESGRRARVLDVVRLFAGKSYLVPPEVGIAKLSGGSGEHGR